MDKFHLNNLLNGLFREYLATLDVRYVRAYYFLISIYHYRDANTYFRKHHNMIPTRKGDETFLSDSNIQIMNDYLQEWRNIIFKELPSLEVLQTFVDYGLIESPIIEFIRCVSPPKKYSYIADHMLIFLDSDVGITMPKEDNVLSKENIKRMNEVLPGWKIILENRPYLYKDISHVLANYGLIKL
jgi:hypothetical protein